MPVCKKCHRRKKKSVHARHEKNCMPSKKDLESFRRSNVNHPEGWKDMNTEGKNAARERMKATKR